MGFILESQDLNGILEIELDSSFDLIRTELDQVNAYISGCMSFSDVSFDSYIDGLPNRNRRMIRPALLLLAGKVFGGLKEPHILAAAMIEMIHRAALLHDQVGSLERFRQNSNHNTKAILFGDLFLSQVFTLQSRLKVPELGDIISQTALSLITGGLQLKLRKGNVVLEDYIGTIGLKTAMLFQSSCRLGALIAGAPDVQIQILSQYGYRLGMAYQLTDDLLTVLKAREQMTGPTAEWLLDKQVLPVIHYLGQNGHIKLDRKISAESLVLKMKQAGSIHYTLEMIKSFTDEANRSLHLLTSGPEVLSLSSLSSRIWTSVSALKVSELGL